MQFFFNFVDTKLLPTSRKGFGDTVLSALLLQLTRHLCSCDSASKYLKAIGGGHTDSWPSAFCIREIVVIKVACSCNCDLKQF